MIALDPSYTDILLPLEVKVTADAETKPLDHYPKIINSVGFAEKKLKTRKVRRRRKKKLPAVVIGFRGVKSTVHKSRKRKRVFGGGIALSGQETAQLTADTAEADEVSADLSVLGCPDDTSTATASEEQEGDDSLDENDDDDPYED
jgi:hypothetical protein